MRKSAESTKWKGWYLKEDKYVTHLTTLPLKLKGELFSLSDWLRDLQVGALKFLISNLCCLVVLTCMCLWEFHTSSCLSGLTTAASGTYAFLAALKVLLLLPQGLMHFQLPQRSYYCCLSSWLKGWSSLVHSRAPWLNQIMQILDHGSWIMDVRHRPSHRNTSSWQILWRVEKIAGRESSPGEELLPWLSECPHDQSQLASQRWLCWQWNGDRIWSP